MKKFWMVYLEGQRGPAYKHETLESARNEAERLTLTHGCRAYVLGLEHSVMIAGFCWTAATESGDDTMPGIPSETDNNKPIEWGN